MKTKCNQINSKKKKLINKKMIQKIKNKNLKIIIKIISKKKNNKKKR